MGGVESVFHPLCLKFLVARRISTVAPITPPKKRVGLRMSLARLGDDARGISPSPRGLWAISVASVSDHPRPNLPTDAARGEIAHRDFPRTYGKCRRPDAV